MERKARKICILGAGSWGTALATLIGDGADVVLWARTPGLAEAINAQSENRRYLPGIRLSANVRATPVMHEALDGAECVVFAVPSGAMREVAQLAGPLLGNARLLVNASKGLEEETGLRMSQVIEEGLGGADERIAALSGPNLAVEVAQGVPTASVAAARNEETAQACQLLWMGPTFRVYTSDDLVGVELAGAMKNVIAIGAGICEGIGFGDNSRAAFMTRGLAEITRLGVALGARPTTFLGLAGVGDLIATGGSRLSRNYRVGIGLGQGKQLQEILQELGQVAEGVPTTRAICCLARQANVEMPISEALYSILFEGASVHRTLRALMMRPAKPEV
ncbi:MAG: NAD(P)H-dependent glycerol-3-phosphate dehydrogenase [Chthonomonadales bacterium]